MKSIQQLLLALFVSVFLPTLTTAQDLTVKGQSIIRSQYVGFDDGLMLYPDPVLQGNLTLQYESGFFFDLWWSSGFNSSWSTDWDDELDYAFGWNGNIKGLDFTVAAAYFDNFGVGAGPFNDVLRTTVKVGLPEIEVCDNFSLVPSVSYSGFFIPDGKTSFDGGHILAVGFDTQTKITRGLSIASSTSVGWDDGVFEKKSGAIFKHSSTLNVVISKNVTWNALEATVYVPIGDRNLKTETVFGTGLSFSF